MGYLPIIVALLGFILLFTVYIYGQIKPRKTNMTSIMDKMESVSRERKQLILSYHNANQDSPFGDVAEQLKKISTDRFQSFSKEESLMIDMNLVVSKVSDKMVATKIERLNEEQKQLIRTLKTTSGEYNRFISSPSN